MVDLSDLYLHRRATHPARSHAHRGCKAHCARRHDEDAPDGFAEEQPQTDEKTEPQSQPEPEAEPIAEEEAETEEETKEEDPVLAAINSAVAAAIEESVAVKSTSEQNKASPADLLDEDEAAKAAQEAADEYIQDAAAAFGDEDEA